MSHLNVQLPDSLYKTLQVLAQQDGISVDQFIATAVAEKIAALTTEAYLEDLAKRGSRELKRSDTGLPLQINTPAIS
jgi:hypothetical protein